MGLSRTRTSCVFSIAVGGYGGRLGKGSGRKPRDREAKSQSPPYYNVSQHALPFVLNTPDTLRPLVVPSRCPDRAACKRRNPYGKRSLHSNKIGLGISKAGFTHPLWIPCLKQWLRHWHGMTEGEARNDEGGVQECQKTYEIFMLHFQPISYIITPSLE